MALEGPIICSWSYFKFVVVGGADSPNFNWTVAWIMVLVVVWTITTMELETIIKQQWWTAFGGWLAGGGMWWFCY